MATLNSSVGASLKIAEMNKDLGVVVRISGTENQVRQAYRHFQQLVEYAGSNSAENVCTPACQALVLVLHSLHGQAHGQCYLEGISYD